LVNPEDAGDAGDSGATRSCATGMTRSESAARSQMTDHASVARSQMSAGGQCPDTWRQMALACRPRRSGS
jgi:hypothetical protein